LVTVIAIDGPAGAGKSTVARALAERLGLEYLDTGAMYRAVAVGARLAGLDPASGDPVAELARTADLAVGEGGVFLDGVDVTTAIRTTQATTDVSAVASNPAVRAELVTRQRAWGAERGGGVIEGRDIGTVVFPDAILKVYLTASPRERAERRVAEAGGDLDAVEASIARRDAIDRGRADGPLLEADGAVVVDTTGRPISDIVDELQALVHARRSLPGHDRTMTDEQQ
jgi:cytidylate kinase